MTYSMISFNSLAIAYSDKLTHPMLTEEAVNKSHLEEYIKRMGFTSKQQVLTNNNYIEMSKRGRTKSILQWLADGSEFEDVGSRAKNHFYNPIRNEGLYELIWLLGGAGWIRPFFPVPIPFTGFPNKNWAAGYDDNGGSEYICDPGDNFRNETCNDYSYRKAKYTYFEALTPEYLLNKSG